VGGRAESHRKRCGRGGRRSGAYERRRVFAGNFRARRRSGAPALARAFARRRGAGAPRVGPQTVPRARPHLPPARQLSAPEGPVVAGPARRCRNAPRRTARHAPRPCPETLSGRTAFRASTDGSPGGAPFVGRAEECSVPRAYTARRTTACVQMRLDWTVLHVSRALVRRSAHPCPTASHTPDSTSSAPCTAFHPAGRHPMPQSHVVDNESIVQVSLSSVHAAKLLNALHDPLALNLF
jgi:hypothetical protein